MTRRKEERSISSASAQARVQSSGLAQLELLRRLLETLAQQSRPSDAGHEMPHWEDDDYFYVESILSDESISDLDVNIHDNIVLIRIAR